MEVIVLIPEQIESLGKEELGGKEQEKRLHENVEPLEEMIDFIDEGVRKDMRAISLKISHDHNSYNDAEELPIGEAVTNVANGWLESIKNAKKEKVILSVALNPARGGQAIIDSLIHRLNHLTNNDANVKGDDKCKLEPIWFEIYDLVSEGNYVSEEVAKLLPKYILKKRGEYLSNLKEIVADSIENGDKEGIVVHRDNAFYCVKCPEECIITPAKFMNSREFKDLKYGALRMGEGDNIIRLCNGQYHDMKGKVKMTFKVDNEKLEMTLLSEKSDEPENKAKFGPIMVHMDDKNCEIFLKYYETLKRQPRIEKIVDLARSFVKEKKLEKKW